MNWCRQRGTDGLPAAIRHLETLSQKSVDALNHRKEVIVSMVEVESTIETYDEKINLDENEEK